MAYDQEIGSMTVYMEASGEGPDGMLAVAFVIVNRWRKNRWGATIAAVCFEPHQFSCWYYGGPNMERVANILDSDPALSVASLALLKAIHNDIPDPTGGALYYFADSIPKPTWADNLTMTAHVGHHEFYK